MYHVELMVLCDKDLIVYFYEIDSQSLPRTCHFCLTENESNSIFRVKMQAVEQDSGTRLPRTTALTTFRRAKKAARQRLQFYFSCTNQSGLIQAKESEPSRKNKSFR